MPIRRVPDHVDQALDLLLTQYQERPRFAAWLRSYLRQVQLLSDATFAVILARMIDRAVGAQLDQIGRIVGELRQDRVDGLYRIFIRARIRINRSQGTIVDIIDVLNIIAGVPFLADEAFPSAYLVELEEEPEIDPVLIFRALQDTKAGGIGMNMISPTTTPDMQFRFSDANSVDNDPDQGFGDANDPDTFGLLSAAVRG